MTRLPVSTVRAMLQARWGEVSHVHRLAESLDSQAFGFRCGTDDLVVRINRSRRGFEKDAFVQRRFGSCLPIPEIMAIGRLDDGHHFCVSRRATGVRIHDLDTADLPWIAGPAADMMAAIAAADLAGTSGFGHFDATGAGADLTWRGFLAAIVDPQRFDWRAADLKVRALLGRGLRLVEELAGHCPERRRLIHGDFGSYNLLTDGRRIAAVIDWDRALFGDPLYEAAGVLFWREACLEGLCRRLEAPVGDQPEWPRRLLCYQLRFGLQELHESATGRTPVDLGWLTARCKSLVDQAGT